MARIVGAVDFEGGMRLFLVFDRTTGIALRPLFETEDDARRWGDESPVEYVQPSNAVATDETVEVVTDLAFAGNRLFVFKSRASRKAMWLTGPLSREKEYEENDRAHGGDWYVPIDTPLD